MICLFFLSFVQLFRFLIMHLKGHIVRVVYFLSDHLKLTSAARNQLCVYIHLVICHVGHLPDEGGGFLGPQ